MELFVQPTRQAMQRLLIRGDSLGQIVLWDIPIIADKNLKLVRQESFDKLPGQYLLCSF
jgi:hypothetical protein